MLQVPFVDLFAQYLTIKEEIDMAISNAIKNCDFIGGETVKEFENAFADYLGVKNFVSCANGTDSLEILMKAYGIGPNDEVIVPAHTWISTAESVGSLSATPVFVDCRRDFYTIDTSQIEAKITSRTKAIIPVHLCGLPADMDEIMRISAKYKLIVIEDCAQSHGATYKGKKVGTIGHASSFSFYPGKNLGAYGDAGGIATNDDNIAETCRMLANHGQNGKHVHRMEGRNSRMDGLQAAILSVKLKYLTKWTKQRQENAAVYNTLLGNSKTIQIPVCPPHSTHVYHLYMVQVDKREKVMNYLKDNGIQTAIHYPHGLPFVDCYKDRHHNDSFPNVARYQDRIISLPMYAELGEKEIAHVADTLKSIVGE